jgi:hypothetical protein
MTKSEKEYIKKLVQDNNNLIQEVYDKTRLGFMSKDQREGFIQGVSAALECFANFVNMEVVGVDLNHIPE